MDTITDVASDDLATSVEIEDPTAGGQVEEIDTTPTEQPNVLNLEEFTDYVVDVGGEFVPVTELKGGGLRQADYTRKTQEVAELRKEAERALTLERAMQVNPKGTLQWLAEQHGLTVAEAAAAVAAQQQTNEDDWWNDDTSSQPSNDLAARLERIERLEQEREAQRQFDTMFRGLKAKYGDDFNEQEVARAAAERGIYDPQLMELVYRDLAYEKLTTARSQAQTISQQQAEENERKRQQAAQSAAAATGAGPSSVGVSTAPVPKRNLTVREAAELAWEQLTSGL